MKLDKELRFRKGFDSLPHEAVLSLYYTSAQIKKAADAFFKQHGLTDVQFNLLMLLQHQSGGEPGLTQVDLSRMMLVNRANITSLVDRMEKAELVRRLPVPGDRRYNVVALTDRGRALLLEVEENYRSVIELLMGGLSKKETAELLGLLERIRERVRGVDVN